MLNVSTIAIFFNEKYVEGGNVTVIILRVVKNFEYKIRKNLQAVRLMISDFQRLYTSYIWQACYKILAIEIRYSLISSVSISRSSVNKSEF